MFKEKKKYCIWKQDGQFSFLEKLFLQYPDNNWNHAFLAMNPNISLDFIEKYIDKEEIKYTALNPNITRDFMEKHPEVFSVKGGFDLNIALTLDDYLFIGGKTKYIGKNRNIDIFYKILTREKYNLENPNLFWEIIADNGHEKWDWDVLLRQPVLDWDIVRKIEGVLWRRLSQNPNITWEIVENNPNKPWDYNGLSENPNISWDIVKNNLDKPWDWNYLSENLDITRDIDNMCMLCDFYSLTGNPNITFDIIESNPDLPWKMHFFSQNPNLNIYGMDIHEIDFRDISRNQFIYNDTVYKREKKKDVKLRQKYVKLIFEKLSAFSRNIDKVIFKRLNYT